MVVVISIVVVVVVVVERELFKLLVEEFCSLTHAAIGILQSLACVCVHKTIC